MQLLPLQTDEIEGDCLPDGYKTPCKQTTPLLLNGEAGSSQHDVLLTQAPTWPPPSDHAATLLASGLHACIPHRTAVCLHPTRGLQPAAGTTDGHHATSLYPTHDMH